MSLMDGWVDLGSPRPRETPQRYAPLKWPLGARIALPVPAFPSGSSRSCAELLLQRRTKRVFSRLSLEMLSKLTWLTCQVQGTGGDELGFALSHRPCPSAGAIHPIHLLVIDPQAGRWLRYDAVSHALDEVITQLEPSGVLAEMHSVLPATSATLLILAAEPGKTAAKYEAAESLVWRDAGVLLGFLALAAEALGLNYCPLGVTGEPWVGRLLDQPGLAGVGAAFVGAPPD